jgi:hypothetical protein
MSSKGSKKYEATRKHVAKLWAEWKRNPEKFLPSMFARNDPQSRLTLAHFVTPADLGWNPANGHYRAGRPSTY